MFRYLATTPVVLAREATTPEVLAEGEERAKGIWKLVTEGGRSSRRARRRGSPLSFALAPGAGRGHAPEQNGSHAPRPRPPRRHVLRAHILSQGYGRTVVPTTTLVASPGGRLTKTRNCTFLMLSNTGCPSPTGNGNVGGRC